MVAKLPTLDVRKALDEIYKFLDARVLKRKYRPRALRKFVCVNEIIVDYVQCNIVFVLNTTVRVALITDVERRRPKKRFRGSLDFV